LALQVFTIDYPAVREVSSDASILHEAQYYIYFLTRCDKFTSTAAASEAGAAENDVTDEKIIKEEKDNHDDDDDDRHLISLHKLLAFPRLEKFCEGNINTLRY